MTDNILEVDKIIRIVAQTQMEEAMKKVCRR